MLRSTTWRLRRRITRRTSRPPQLRLWRPGNFQILAPGVRLPPDDIPVDSADGTNTLSGLAAYINGQNLGVTASVVATDAGGARLFRSRAIPAAVAAISRSRRHGRARIHQTGHGAGCASADSRRGAHLVRDQHRYVRDSGRDAQPSCRASGDERGRDHRARHHADFRCDQVRLSRHTTRWCRPSTRNTRSTPRTASRVSSRVLQHAFIDPRYPGQRRQFFRRKWQFEFHQPSEHGHQHERRWNA